jgi:uncharacterized protein YndB with AHSA1/START domain
VAKKILIGVAVVVVLFLVVVAMQSSKFEVSRETTIAVAPSAVMPFIADLKNMEQWSPWEGMEGDNLKKTYHGEPGKVGHGYHWTGDVTGEGEMTIASIEPDKSVHYDLHFIKPFEAMNKTSMTLTAEGNGTKVRWDLSGPKNFMMKAMGLFMSFEKAISKDFDKGLAQLKAKAEAAPATTPMTTTTGGTATGG